MKKLILPIIAISSLIFSGCVKENMTKWEIPKNTERTSVQQESTISSWAQNSSWALKIENNTGVTSHPEMSKKETIDLIKSVNNENPIFSEKNSLSNEIFRYNESSDADLKKFLKIANLPFLYTEKGFIGNEISEDSCQKITKIYTWNHQAADTCSDRLIFADLYGINKDFIYLSIYWKWLGWESYAELLYDRKKWKFYNISDIFKKLAIELDGNTGVYFYNDKLWFMSIWWFILWSYDVRTSEFKDHSEIMYNKSHKWKTEYMSGNLVITSFDGMKKIDLWNIPSWKTKTASGVRFDFFWTGTYFETNEDDTKFAYMEESSVMDRWDNTYVVSVVYWDVKENGLKDVKRIELRLWLFETMCWASANGTFFLRDNLFISSWNGCPMYLQMSVFDMDTGKFLYKLDSLERTDY